MAPRELVIGATAVVIQLLYSSCFPYIEPAGKHLAYLVDSVKWNDLFSGLKVSNGHASKSLDSDLDSSYGEIDVESAVRLRLQPHIDHLVQTFKNGDDLEFHSVEGIDVSFDVSRAVDIFKIAGSKQQPWAYFFRVTVQNKAKRAFNLQSVARGYVLRMTGGKVFPVSRMTEGPAGYILQPGDEYSYAWTFLTSRQVLEASGSLLFTKKDATNGDTERQPMRFVNATLGLVKPPDAPMVSSEEELQKLVDGHNYMGTLDFRHVEYV